MDVDFSTGGKVLGGVPWGPENNLLGVPEASLWGPLDILYLCITRRKECNVSKGLINIL